VTPIVSTSQTAGLHERCSGLLGQPSSAVIPGPTLVSITALGLRRITLPLPAWSVAGFGLLMMAIGGALIGISLTPKPDYAADILPGWLLIGIGVGFVLPTLIPAAASQLAPHESSAGSARVQMAQPIAAVLGVTAVVVIIGSSSIATADADLVIGASLWWSAGFALVAALTCLPLITRTRKPDREATTAHQPTKDAV
jgi:hypothetical protein